MKKTQFVLWTTLVGLLLLAGCQSATDEKDDEKVASYTTASDAIKAKAFGGLLAVSSGLYDAEAEVGVPYDTETLDVSVTLSGAVATSSITLTSYDVNGTTYTGTATVTVSETQNHWKGSLTLGGAGAGSVAFDLELNTTETTEGTVTTYTTFATGTFTVDGTKYSLDNVTLSVSTDDSAATE